MSAKDHAIDIAIVLGVLLGIVVVCAFPFAVAYGALLLFGEKVAGLAAVAGVVLVAALYAWALGKAL